MLVVGDGQGEPPELPYAFGKRMAELLDEETMLSDEIEAQLSAIESKALEIEAAFDDLNDALEQIEDRLEQAPAMAVVGILVPDVSWTLGYEKTANDKWKITATEKGRDPEVQILSGSSRAIRIHALKNIHHLLIAIQVRQQEILDSLRTKKS